MQAFVKNRERSHFVSEAIRKELAYRKEELQHAYLMANQDEGQRQANEEWLDTLVDGMNDW